MIDESAWIRLCSTEIWLEERRNLKSVKEIHNHHKPLNFRR
jgi:hypothetical protein